MSRFRATAAALACLAAAASAWSQTGNVPLTDLGAGQYKGYEGGLYPGGTNTPPAGHLADALALAQHIVPRNAAGDPDPDGWIVLIAIGMSNTAHEFAVFERQADADAGRNARVVILDTALGGQAATQIAPPNAPYWTVLDDRLKAMGLTARQVQAAWMKQAEKNPADNFPIHAQGLRDNLELIANNLHDKFPNLRLCYCSSRIYGGYAPPGSLNPEPQAYEGGFAVKWLIRDQIDGDPGLSYGQRGGPVEAPLLLWGPYLWADGPTPRSDGLVWLPEDLENDKTHPSPSGEQKVADMLSAFFEAEPTAHAWWPKQAGARLVVVPAGDDAYDSSAKPMDYFGLLPELLTSGGADTRRTFLKFDASPVPRPVLLAKLSLRVIGGGGGPTRLVADTSWTEGDLAYYNAPPIGPAQFQHPQTSKDGTYDGAVTAALNADGDGVLALALSSTSQQALAYRSRQTDQPPRLVLVVADECPADCDGSGSLDIDDFVCFQGLFATGDAGADCDGSGSLDIDDFLCFQAAFAAGCR